MIHKESGRGKNIRLHSSVYDRNNIISHHCRLRLRHHHRLHRPHPFRLPLRLEEGELDETDVIFAVHVLEQASKQVKRNGAWEEWT